MHERKGYQDFHSSPDASTKTCRKATEKIMDIHMNTSMHMYTKCTHAHIHEHMLAEAYACTHAHTNLWASKHVDTCGHIGLYTSCIIVYRA